MEMQYGEVPGVGKPVSRLVQGTVMLTTKDLDYSFRVLDEVYALGCRTFDTAHGYGAGDVERAFGRWIGERGLREEIVILGKGAHHNQDRQRVTPFDITSDLHDSLARLKTDYIDLYLLHRDDPALPVGPLVEVLNEHQRAGKIRAFGGSNWTVGRIEEANEYARANGLAPFVASSPNLSLAEQVKEPWPNCISISGPQGEAAREWYARARMPLFTWSSLAGGFFTGRFTRDNLAEFAGGKDSSTVQAYCYEPNFRRLDRARELAEERGVTIPQVALAYVLSQPLDIYALVGCRSGAEFRDNLEALALKLTPEEIAWLELKADSRAQGAAA